MSAAPIGLGETALLFEPAERVVHLGFSQPAVELIHDVLGRTPAVDQRGDQLVESAAQQRGALLGEQEDALAGHRLHPEMGLEPRHVDHR